MDEQDDYKEKYMRLRDENTQLKKVKNEQELTIKRMYTKLAMIEENMKRKAMGEEMIQQPKEIKFDMELSTMKQQMSELKRKNQMLMEKNKQLKIQRKPTKKRTVNVNEYASSSNSKDKALIQSLRKRLMVAEKQLVNAQHASEQTILRSPSHTSKKPHEMEDLSRELRDKQAKLSILTNRYEKLESKSKAERDIQSRTLEQMETFNRAIRELRKQLQQVSAERDEYAARALKCREYEQEMETLRLQVSKFIRVTICLRDATES